MIEELPKGFHDVAFGQRFSLTPNHIFVIGGSFAELPQSLHRSMIGYRK